MTSQVLLTHHHHRAMENAAERGFWMPLPLQGDQLTQVRYLSAISRGQGRLTALVEITSFEPWRDGSGVEQWLPFLGQRLELPRAIPLGNRRLLAGWLPQRREHSQIVDLLALLAAERLSDFVVPADPQGARLGCCCGGAPQRTGVSRMACGSAECKSRSFASGRE